MFANMFCDGNSALKLHQLVLLGIDTSIFGQNGVTHDSAISPYPEAKQIGDVTLTGNQGINFYSIMVPERLIKHMQIRCVQAANCAEDCFKSGLMRNTVVNHCNSSLLSYPRWPL